MPYDKLVNQWTLKQDKVIQIEIVERIKAKRTNKIAIGKYYA